VLLSMRELFGELSDQPVFCAAVGDALERLYRDGARAALNHVLS